MNVSTSTQEDMFVEFLGALRQALFEVCRRDEGDLSANVLRFVEDNHVATGSYWRSLNYAAGLLTQRIVGMDREALTKNGTFEKTVAEVLVFTDNTSPIDRCRKVTPKSEQDKTRLNELLLATFRRVAR